MQYYTTNFQSWTSYIDHVEAAPDSPHWTAEKRTFTTGASAFHGGLTFADSISLARKGWPEGIGQIKAAAASISRKAPGKAREYDVAGMYPDAARAAAGDPCSMITPTPGEIKGPAVITLILTCNGNAAIDAQSWMNRAGAVAVLCDALESDENVRLEIWAFWGTTAGRDDLGMRNLFVKIKSPQDPLSLGNLAAVCHPTAHRRLNFRMIETFTANPAHSAGCFGGYGYSQPISKVPAEELPVISALCLPSISNNADRTPAASWQTLETWANANGLPIAQI